MPVAYRIKASPPAHAPEGVTVGSTVYSIRGHDYGLASDDSRWTGVEHISVTLNADGDYPSFTIPRRDLERLETSHEH
jgi:hypothetical protein